MLFRDDKRSIFPRKSVRTKDIIEVKEKDHKMNLQRTDEMNESKHKKQDEIDIGDRIHIRNYRKQHKFHSLFLPKPYILLILLSVLTKIMLPVTYPECFWADRLHLGVPSLAVPKNTLPGCACS